MRSAWLVHRREEFAIYAQADKDENVAQVLWIPRKPVGSGRDESGFLSEGILCTSVADPPDHQQSTEYRERNPNDEAETVLE